MTGKLTLENWHSFPYRDDSETAELSEGELEVDEGKAGNDNHDDVWDEECTCRNKKKVLLLWIC